MFDCTYVVVWSALQLRKDKGQTPMEHEVAPCRTTIESLLQIMRVRYWASVL